MNMRASVRVTMGAGLKSVWSHTWGQGAEVSFGHLSGLSKDPQTQDPCLWPLLGAYGAAVGLAGPLRPLPRPGPRGLSRGPHGGGWHPVTVTLPGSQGNAQAPDLTTAQIIRMVWGGLFLAATQEVAQAALEASPAVPVGDFTTQTSRPQVLQGLLLSSLLICFVCLFYGFFCGGSWVTTLLFPAWPKPEAQPVLTPLSSPTAVWGHPGLGPLSLPAGH